MQKNSRIDELGVKSMDGHDINRIVYSGELFHFGIKGQKWGVRRFQNEDGSLTPEGKQRYLEDDNKQIEIMNKTVDKSNADLRKINKKYDKVSLDDDEANLKYTKEVIDAWKKNYRDVLAKDLQTDPSLLEGQKWLDDMFGYKTSMDDEYEELKRKIDDKKKSSSEVGSINKSKNTASISKESYTDKYAKTKMTQKKAIDTAYADLEKLHPNFNKLPIEKQDELFFDYLNESGLYRWV